MEVIPSSPLNFMPIDTRALKRRSLSPEARTPQLISKEARAVGQRLLQQAQKFHTQRIVDSDSKIEAACNEAGSDIHHMLRGRVYSYGGFGKGKRFGAGRWRYIDGQWIKRD